MYMNDGNKTKINLRNKSVFITGVAGFIGSNLAKRLLSTVEGVKVVGLDNMNHYYDVRLKEARLNELEQFDNFSFVKGNLADKAVIESIFEQYKPEIVVNLGAQAGVRYSITNPDAYVEANLIGFYNILEACRHSYDEGHTPVEHLVYASSSSVYGSNKKVPYSTDDKVDNPVSLYAATKKSNELMAHAYSKLYNIPSTGLRFFTVYGPAGRPDMAYFGFTNKLLQFSFSFFLPFLLVFSIFSLCCLPCFQPLAIILPKFPFHSFSLFSSPVIFLPHIYSFSPICLTESGK